jgi:hypothetical protein
MSSTLGISAFYCRVVVGPDGLECWHRFISDLCCVASVKTDIAQRNNTERREGRLLQTAFSTLWRCLDGRLTYVVCLFTFCSVNDALSLSLSLSQASVSHAVEKRKYSAETDAHIFLRRLSTLALCTGTHLNVLTVRVVR